MVATTCDSIRRIFLSRHLSVSETTAAALLGRSVRSIRRDIADGAIVATSTRAGVRIPRSEMIAAALRTWTHATIEEALAADADRALPDALRLTELRARVPRYQREMLQYFARRDRRSLDDVIARQFEDLASAHSEELARAIPNFSAALSWPDLN